MKDQLSTITYPRRRVIRGILKTLIQGAFAILSDFKVVGKENLPKEGPLLIVGNHFSFIDPVALIGALPYPLEFVGGSQTPNAPPTVSWFARVYGILPVRRGSISGDTLRSSKKVLDQNGILGIFPEGGSWAAVLRPARPGSAYLATCTKAQILPIGLDGFTEMFPTLRRGKRPRVTLTIGKPFGPFFVSERGETERKELDEIGHEFMRRIAELLPREKRGFYSDDPTIRETSLEAAKYPWENIQEQ